jgi:hypothetical protein
MTPEVIDDQSLPFPATPRGTLWTVVTDAVMGGLSRGRVVGSVIAGRRAVRLTGQVSLANDGGFVQAALDLAPGGAAVDARGWHGIAFAAIGAGAAYNVHLRTTDLGRPWQSYRAGFVAGPAWADVLLPFAAFVPHRTDRPFDPARLRRIGIVAIGREMPADVAVAGLRFY